MLKKLKDFLKSSAFKQLLASFIQRKLDEWRRRKGY